MLLDTDMNNKQDFYFYYSLYDVYVERCMLNMWV